MLTMRKFNLAFAFFTVSLVSYMNRWLQQEPFVGQHETHYTYAVLSNRVPTNCVPKPQEINFVSVHSFHNKTGQTTIGQTTQHALNSSSP